MAPRNSVLSFHIPTTLTLTLTTLILLLSRTANSCFTRIFCFGDSISDTGNYLQSVGNRYDPVGNLPYGETYFGYPTGRFSDGRVILDFIAEAYGVPLLPPYLSGKDDTANAFPHGANFAVGGATAMNASYFESKGMEAFWTGSSLDIQLQWFKELLPSVLQKPGCGNDAMSNTLFVLGEIGGNDYNHPLFSGLSLDEVRTFVPDVIRTISLAIHELIARGAKTLLVPGNFPIGCVPTYLTQFQTHKSEDYDPETGCIKRLNEFAQYHNKLLTKELAKLRLLYPDVIIVYADYFEAAMEIFRNPKKLGFSYPLMPCCGSRGTYNYSALGSCGNKGCNLCPDPSKYASWDGLHMTEAAYKVISHGVLQGTHSSPPLSNVCSDIMRNATGSRGLPPAHAQCSG